LILLNFSRLVERPVVVLAMLARLRHFVGRRVLGVCVLCAHVCVYVCVCVCVARVRSMHTCVGVWLLRIVRVVVVLRFQCRVCDKAQEVVA
jgi:hypothetical protein